MIATHNGHAVNGKPDNDLINRLVKLDAEYYAKRSEREPSSSYNAGNADRMNPVPKGIDPYGTDADYHYSTERNYFLMVERGRAAVRNHPLVGQGILRLIANLGLGEFTLDINSGDKGLDKGFKERWTGWTEDKQQCDYEQVQTFRQKACQSFFSEVADGDILHVPLRDGSLQTFESHHLRNPFGHRPTGSDQFGIVHGVEIINGKPAGYWLTPHTLSYYQRLSSRRQSRRYPAFDEIGNPNVFWLGFTHRFRQRRGISRMAAPRDAMNGADDLNYAHIKSALRRALISYLMSSPQNTGATQNPLLPGGKIPQTGARYGESVKDEFGLKTMIVEQLGEPAQVLQATNGQKIEGWNANLPGSGFFEQEAFLLTCVAVNLDLPLMFFLLDGSLVNFHGGRMTFDQAKLRFRQLQLDQAEGFYNPTYEWKVRQWCTPGSPHYDRAAAVAVAKGANPFVYRFRPKGWPYVKPMEDAAAEDLSERRNLRSLRAILADRGVDLDEHRPEVIGDRARWFMTALRRAEKIVAKYPSLNLEKVAMLIGYGTDPSGVQWAMNTEATGEQSSEPKPKSAGRKGDDEN
jgi:hypothetical protein